MSDPLVSLFGRTSLDLFASPELVVTHGALARFPAFLRTGPLSDAESLCRHYTGPLEVSKGTAAEGLQTPVKGAHASALLRLGLTVYFPELRRSLPESRGFLTSLEAALGLPECISLSAFANAAKSGLPLHHDRYDQLFFQLRGEKLFRHRPNGYVKQPDLPFTPLSTSATEWGQTYRNGFPLSTNEVIEQGLESLTLSPGSAFFMPAGTWHTTADQTGDALSAVVVVRAPSRLALLGNLLRYYAGQSEDFRARPYGAWSKDEKVHQQEHQKLALLLVDLGERLKTVPPSDAYKAWSLTGYLEGDKAYPRDVSFTRYVRLPSSSARFEGGPDAEHVKCTIRSGPATRPQTETQLLFHTHAQGIVEWILTTRAAFTVEEVNSRFPDYAPPELEAFLTTLAEAALVRPLPVSEWQTQNPRQSE